VFWGWKRTFWGNLEAKLSTDNLLGQKFSAGYGIKSKKLIHQVIMTVFFNLFCSSGTLNKSEGTPCIDPCIQRRTRFRNYRLISLAGQSPHGDDKAGEGDQLYHEI